MFITIINGTTEYYYTDKYSAKLKAIREKKRGAESAVVVNEHNNILWTL